jgi:hypothetical protein
VGGDRRGVAEGEGERRARGLDLTRGGGREAVACGEAAGLLLP